MLDVGTNNETLLSDPYYVGLRQKRLSGAAYDEFVDEFIVAARAAFPGVLIQFEDFANHSAFHLLQKYRDSIPTFNDDIQGTASVALAGLFSALRVTGGRLSDQKLLFLGAGEAATGIADLVVAAMMAEGTSETEARLRVWLVNSRGLVVKNRESLTEHKLRYAHDHPPVAGFLNAIRALKPSAIIGVAAVGNTFTPEVLQLMAQLNKRPSYLPSPIRHQNRSARPRTLTATPVDAHSSHAAVHTILFSRGQKVRAKAREQLVHLPRCRLGRHRERHAARDR